MKIKTFEFNPIFVNTYVLYDDTKECVVIDASCFYPDEKDTIFNFIVDNELTPKMLINTHLHFDHIFGVNYLASEFNLKFGAHKDDLYLVEDLQNQLRMFGVDSDSVTKPNIDVLLTENDVIKFGNQELKILHIPGHSPGSLVYYNEKAGTLFTGDVLFRQGIGRTDLPGGNYRHLLDGIKTKLFTLPDETVVYPGHGPASTIGFEKANNPFLGMDIL